MPETFEVSIYDPLPNGQESDRLAVQARTTALSWSTSFPGGFDGADLGFANDVVDRGAWLATPVNAKHFGHVQIRVADFVCFEGRIWRLDRSDGGQVKALSAHGYGFVGMADGVYTASGATYTAGNVLARAIGQAAPLISVNPDPAFWVDPGTARPDTQFAGRTPGQIAEQVQREGGNVANAVANAPWDFAVWERRQAMFLPRVPPALDAVYYEFPLDGVVNWTEDSSEMYGALQSNYGASGATQNTVTSSVPNWADSYGILRTKQLDAGNIDAVGIQQYQLTQLALMSVPKISISVSYGGDRPLLSPRGGTWYGWQARAGHWCTVGGQGPYCIVHTEFNAAGGSFSATLETYPPSYLKLLHDLWRSNRLLQSGLNLNTAAKGV